MTTTNVISTVGLIGIGGLLATILQHFTSKRLKKFETKLILFRRVYKQLYYVRLRYYDDINALEADETIDINAVASRVGLAFEKDLGDILFYVEEQLKRDIETIIFTLHEEHGQFGKKDFEAVKRAEKLLKKLS